MPTVDIAALPAWPRQAAPSMGSRGNGSGERGALATAGALSLGDSVRASECGIRAGARVHVYLRPNVRSWCSRRQLTWVQQRQLIGASAGAVSDDGRGASTRSGRGVAAVVLAGAGRWPGAHALLG